MSDWIDVSVPLSTGITVWPGDPAVEIVRFSRMSDGAPCNVSSISTSLHAGTHVDPLHYVDRGIDIAHLPIDHLCGPARVIGLRDAVEINADVLRQHCPERGERLLLKTANSAGEWWRQPFRPDYCHLTRDGADYLAKCGVRTVGIDYLSIGPGGREGDLVHRALLPAGVAIIEGLVLGDVPWGRYEMLGLPLRIDGGDGSPARILLRPL